MKQILNLLIALVILAGFGCRKDRMSALPITGKWELSAKTDGLTGKQTIYNPGNGNILNFGTHNYELYTNGELDKRGTYKVLEEMSYLKKAIANRLVYDNKTEDVRSFVEINEGKLSIYVDASDGPSAIYLKIANKN